MAQELTRKELYNQVWKKPIKRFFSARKSFKCVINFQSESIVSSHERVLTWVVQKHV